MVRPTPFTAAVAAAALGAHPMPAVAQPGPAAASPDPAAKCRQLAAGDYSRLTDAPTIVTAASAVAAVGALPAYCQVTATIKPHVGMQIRLPASGWNGKFLQVVRGGHCRPVTMEECDGPLRKGYACAISDHGNQTPLPDDAWGYDDVQNLTDCGFRGTHVTAVAGKALTQAFYDTPPAHSYLMGCSTGGRMAMVAVQKFPWDFDGVIAGAAPINKSMDGLGLAWGAVSVLDKGGKPLLTPDDLRLVHKAVLARCDKNDGLADGIVNNPRACDFDPAQIQCGAGGKTAECLTKDQADAVRKVYDGPADSKGAALYDGGLMRGSELNWIKSYVAEDGGPSAIYTSATAMYRYMSTPEKGAGYRISQFDWDKDYKTIGVLEAYGNASNPDLRPFKRAGGKLIIYHGYADEFIMPANMIDYYETVQRTLGGADKTRDFARLFMIPGLNHCYGGVGATVFDFIDPLDAWVTTGKAPEVLIGAHPKAGVPRNAPLPLAAADIAFTRPVYPYPMTTRYKGKGDPNLAQSFTTAAPAKP